mmetsp:Transcript_122922/g.192967  ORF Transcript_122922/g.192967 Transcript_122922/m.192967 type:complete len:609 (-) Transcript_122922:145-1971(-)
MEVKAPPAEDSSVGCEIKKVVKLKRRVKRRIPTTASLHPPVDDSTSPLSARSRAHSEPATASKFHDSDDDIFQPIIVSKDNDDESDIGHGSIAQDGDTKNHRPCSRPRSIVVNAGEELFEYEDESLSRQESISSEATTTTTISTSSRKLKLRSKRKQSEKSVTSSLAHDLFPLSASAASIPPAEIRAAVSARKRSASAGVSSKRVSLLCDDSDQENNANSSLVAQNAAGDKGPGKAMGSLETSETQGGLVLPSYNSEPVSKLMHHSSSDSEKKRTVTFGEDVLLASFDSEEDGVEKRSSKGLLSRITKVLNLHGHSHGHGHHGPEPGDGGISTPKRSSFSGVSIGGILRVTSWFGRTKANLSSKRAKADIEETAMSSGGANSCPTCPVMPTLVEGRRRLGVQMCKIFHIGMHSLIISKGDITEFGGDAIVNAANESAVSGGGVSAAIARAAGPQLNEELNALPEVKPLVRIRVGEAKITNGYRLKASKIIHAVGPVYSSVKIQKNSRGVVEHYDWSSLDEKLKRAYKTSIGLATENECHSIGFALLSTGAFCGDRGLEPVLFMGAEALAEALREASSNLRPFEVHMVCNGDKVVKPLAKMCSRLNLES